jgi:preprotein translocase subunit SecD
MRDLGWLGLMLVGTAALAEEVPKRASAGPTFFEVRFVVDQGGKDFLRVDNQHVMLDTKPVVSTFSVAEAHATKNQVDVRLTPTASYAFGELTAANMGKQLAIVVNGIVRTVAPIKAKIPSGGIAFNAMSPAEAEEVVRLLTARP